MCNYILCKLIVIWLQFFAYLGFGFEKSCECNEAVIVGGL